MQTITDAAPRDETGRVRHRGKEQMPKSEINLCLQDFPRDLGGIWVGSGWEEGYQPEGIPGN